MAIDIAALVAPLSEDAPSGPDLAFDSERQQIEASFERSVSDGGGDSEDIDWRGTARLILAQAEKTRDLWLPIYLMRAAANAGDFAMVLDGAELLAGLLEERWADLHPQLEDYEFIGRKAPCESLTKHADFLAPLNRVTLIEHPRLGRYSGADFERFAREGASAANYGMFRALIDATEAPELQALLDRFDQLRAAIKRADAVLTEHAEGDTSTNFDPTYAAIDGLRAAVAAHVPGAAAADAGDGAQGDAGTAGPGLAFAAAGGPAFSGAINSRDDVIRALDAIGAYYARHEPNSPVPLVLRRARAWTTLDFLAVLQDIAPGSLDEAKRVLTSGRTNSDSAQDMDDSSGSTSGSSSSGW